MTSYIILGVISLALAIYNLFFYEPIGLVEKSRLSLIIGLLDTMGTLYISRKNLQPQDFIQIFSEKKSLAMYLLMGIHTMILFLPPLGNMIVNLIISALCFAGIWVISFILRLHSLRIFTKTAKIMVGVN